MNQELLRVLEQITAEEQLILSGNLSVEKERYTTGKEFVIDSKKMLEKGKLIDVRTHTRFIPFPKHKHNYIEIIYMCTGSTTHIINDTSKVVLKAGDLLFLNQNSYQEILPAGEKDIAINFIVLPEFFDVAFTMLDGENLLKDFIIEALRQDSGKSNYLHFKVSDILPIQNLMENIIWSLVNKQPNTRKINQTTMGLLFLQLLNYTDKIEQQENDPYDNYIVLSVLRYIEENYKDGSLTRLAEELNQSVYTLSKLIKRNTGHTYKDLLQMKKFNKAVELLNNTRLSISDIIAAVGYDNTSYFHRVFKNKYHMTPNQFRAKNNKS